MTQTTIVLNPKRTEYGAEDAGKKSMTVAQMIEALKQFPADARIVAAAIAAVTALIVFLQWVFA